MSGSGCPRCRAPRGENEIERTLEREKIRYEKQFAFPDCRHILPLHFDFALFVEDRVAVIEYNGEQHYRKIPINDSPDAYDFDSIVLRDNIKKNYCSSNNIPLLIIPFDQFDMIDVLVVKFVGGLRGALN